MQYDHKFNCQILLLHRNKGRHGVYFGHLRDVKRHCIYFEWKYNSYLNTRSLYPKAPALLDDQISTWLSTIYKVRKLAYRSVNR
jgi:hypothetical protein